MPNRILKESIHTSEKINALTDFQFRLWASLLVYVDDYGRGDARIAVIKGSCFPLRERITNRDVEAALRVLADTGCVSLYEVDGRPYLYFPTWESHQTVRNQKSKFPAPEEALESTCEQLKSIESNCMQLKSIESNCSRNPIQSNPNPNTESESESEGAELPCGPSEPAPGEFSIPLNDGSVYEVPRADVDAFMRLYPAVDVEQELRNMIGWCIGNPKNRKTRSGVQRFITSWLAREQDRGQGANKNARDQRYDTGADPWAGVGRRI